MTGSERRARANKSGKEQLTGGWVVKSGSGRSQGWRAVKREVDRIEKQNQGPVTTLKAMPLSEEDRLLLVEALGLLWGEGRKRLKSLPPGPESDVYRAEVAEAVRQVEELRERVQRG